MSPDVSVVIVSYNVKELLRKCLETLFGHTSPSVALEVFVVDNASSDGSVEMIREQFPAVKLIANERNEGFPAANNVAFRQCTGRFVFMLNPDTEFHEDTISRLVSHFDTHPSLAVVGPKLLNTDGSLQRSAWRSWRLSYIFFDAFHLGSLTPGRFYKDRDWSKPFMAEMLSGAAIFFRREIFMHIGMLDEALFWIEDADFTWRANKVGLKVEYWPGTKLTHHIGQSAKKNYVISLSNQVFNKIKFMRKHGTGFEVFLVKMISFVHVLLKIIFFSLRAPFGAVSRAKLKAYAYTLPRVFNPPQGIR
jgi:N-acetylglucosaminyl-diphospho-decaprenol L-rhamnosyltransferase